MNYNDIGTPVRKTNFGEADIIYTFLTAHHGRVEAIAKGIRKSTSRKRGNIEFGIFTSLHLAKGKNLDVIVEAQMLEYNPDLLEVKGIKFLYSVLPVINKFATDEIHTESIFEEVKKIFITFEIEKALFYEVELKYFLLENQNILPDLTKCSMCKLNFDNIDKYDRKTGFLICNNCSRKIGEERVGEINLPNQSDDLKKLSEKELKVMLNILNTQIKEIL